MCQLRRFLPISGEFDPQLRVLRVELVLHPRPRPMVVALGRPHGRRHAPNEQHVHGRTQGSKDGQDFRHGLGFGVEPKLHRAGHLQRCFASRFDVTLLNGVRPQLFSKHAAAFLCKAQSTAVRQHVIFNDYTSRTKSKELYFSLTLGLVEKEPRIGDGGGGPASLYIWVYRKLNRWTSEMNLRVFLSTSGFCSQTSFPRSRSTFGHLWPSRRGMGTCALQ